MRPAGATSEKAALTDGQGLTASDRQRDTGHMRRVAILVTVVGLLGIAFSAHADMVAKTDGDDTPGRLDIARIAVKHRSAHPNVFIHKITMQRAWDSSLLKSGFHATRQIRATFDVRRKVGYGCIGCISEREVIINFVDGKLRATLYNHLGDPPKRLKSLPVWRPTRRTVAFAVTRKQLRRSDYSSYDWGVVSFFEQRGSEHCRPGSGCSDLVPNGRYNLLTHRL